MKLGFSFSPAGLLTAYHVGVAYHLSRAGVIHPGVPVAGASGGALAAAALGSGVSEDAAVAAMYDVSVRCRAEGTAFRLDRTLFLALEEVLPADAHDAINAREAAVGIAYTEVFPRPRGVIATQFRDRADLMQVLAASSYIPVYSGGPPLTGCRGAYCMDGFFASPRNQFYAPPAVGAEQTIFVSPFSAETFKWGAGVETISPPGSDFPFSVGETIQLALAPPSAALGGDKVLKVLRETGERDAERWVARFRQEAAGGGGGGGGA
mmetsp:Transcript_45209/g.141691  ORF Transcript_45209/g.141691 Transcript_45209/m.141691 type:complete len:265 (-) Transcript_45209:33-827(-)